MVFLLPRKELLYKYGCWSCYNGNWYHMKWRHLSSIAHFSCCDVRMDSSSGSTPVFIPPRRVWCSSLSASRPFMTECALCTISSWEMPIFADQRSLKIFSRRRHDWKKTIGAPFAEILRPNNGRNFLSPPSCLEPNTFVCWPMMSSLTADNWLVTYHVIRETGKASQPIISDTFRRRRRRRGRFRKLIGFGQDPELMEQGVENRKSVSDIQHLNRKSSSFGVGRMLLLLLRK